MTYLILAQDWSLWDNTLDVALRHITEIICESLDIARASIWSLNPADTGFILLNLHDRQSTQNSSGDELLFADYPVYFKALHDERVIDAADACTDSRTAELAENYLDVLGIGAMLDATLRKAGHLSGVLCIEHTGGRRVWSKAEKRFAMSIADLLSQRLIYEDARKNESYYRELSIMQQAIFDGANYSIISTEVDGTVRSFNDAAENMLGYSREEIIGIHSPAIFHDEAEVLARAQELSEQRKETIEPGFEVLVTNTRIGVAEEREWTYIRKDGSRIPVLLSVTAIKDSDENITGFLGIAFDITDRVLTRRALREEEERYRLLFKGASESIFLLKGDCFIDCNPATEKIFGCTREQILNETPYRYSPEYQHDGRLSIDSAIEKIDAAFRGETQRFEWQHLKHDGTPFDAEVSLGNITIEGEPHLLATVRDITERKQTERKLEESREQLLHHNENLKLINELSNNLHGNQSVNAILEETLKVLIALTQTPRVAIYLVDKSEPVLNLIVSNGFDKETIKVGSQLPLNDSLTGLAIEREEILITSDMTKDERLNKPIKTILLEHNLTSAVVIPLIYLDKKIGSINLIYNDHNSFSNIELDTFKALGKTVSLAISNAENTSTLIKQAHHDSLTGLANRQLLHSYFKKNVQDKDSVRASLLLLDLDRFKEINDTLGHHIGDILLQQIGPRLQSLLESNKGLLCRLGGDEFTILTIDESDDAIYHLANAVLDALRKPFYIDSMQLEVDVSIGTARYPLDGNDSHELLRSADVAMYQAKSQGTNIVHYHPSGDKNSPQRLALIASLGTAIRENQLCLHYQPKVNLQSGDIVGFEALVRWQHPELGLLPPDDFIHLAEVSDAIHFLTRSVLEQALQQQHEWRQSGSNYSVAVNLSVRNLIDARCVDHIETLLKKHDTPAGKLELEITETALMFDPDGAVKLLNRISDLGVRLSIDDFGTGYSSLSYLRKMPIDALKIDREFIFNMQHNEQDSVIVQSTIALAHNLNLKVIAEGVENEDMLNTLLQMGCDMAQGYHISKPRPWNEIESWLDKS